jgi:hypothetical protein
MVVRHPLLNVWLLYGGMSGDERQPSTDAHAAGAGTSAPPELLAPQMLLLRPAPVAAVIAVGLALGAVFMSFGDRLGSDGIPSAGVALPGGGGERDTVFSLSADQTTGTFRILPASFQNTPASVLAQLSMPEAEKARLVEKLADRTVRLAAVTVWDTVDEDGDTVDVTAAGFSQRLVIMHKPTTFFLPVLPGGSVVIKAVRDGGGGGVTLGVSTVLGPYRLPALAVGQAVEIPAL